MRKYDENMERDLLEIYCNKCGKKILLENGIIIEGAFITIYFQ